MNTNTLNNELRKGRRLRIVLEFDVADGAPCVNYSVDEVFGDRTSWIMSGGGAETVDEAIQDIQTQLKPARKVSLRD